jgi:hypothetical protein
LGVGYKGVFQTRTQPHNHYDQRQDKGEQDDFPEYYHPEPPFGSSRLNPSYIIAVRGNIANGEPHVKLAGRFRELLD